MRDSLDRELLEVGDGLLGPTLSECATKMVSPQHRHDLDVEQLRCRKGVAVYSGAHPVAVLVVAGEGCVEDAGVNDDHARRESLGWQS